MIRKYAFNMILAGHRYSKSAQVRQSQPVWLQYSTVILEVDFQSTVCVTTDGIKANYGLLLIYMKAG